MDGSPTRTFWVVAVLLVAGIEAVAAASGADATWDLRNYHLYAPFAVLNKPFGVDVAPAHMQGFLPPTLDLIYYAMARSMGWTPALNAVLALPQAAAAAMAFALSCRLVRPRSFGEVVALGMLGAVAASGTAALSTIATSMSEMLPVALVLAAWLTLVQPDLAALPSFRRLFAAGLLVGAACGLKLTLSFAAVALVLALLFLPRRRWSDVLSRPLVFGLGVGCGTAALAGWWWVHQWMHYGNPMFPLMNQIFRSPFAVPESFVDPTFLPRSLGEAFAAPWSWALQLSRSTGESRLRDPRFAVAMVSALLCLVQARRRQAWPMLVVPFWFVLAFALWRVEFSIHRYLSVLELMTGTVIAMAAFPLARRLGRPGWLLAGSLALAAGCWVLTVYPQLNRSTGGVPFAVELGPLPENATVLLLDNEPMAYLAAFADPRIRFVGTNDFFMSLDGHNPMQGEVERAIAGAGPLFGLDNPTEQGDRSVETLAHYRLRRAECRTVATNVSPNPIRLCTLSRAPSAEPGS